MSFRMLPRNYLLEEESQYRLLPSRWNKRTAVRIGISVATLIAGLMILAQGSQTPNFMVTEFLSSTIGTVNEGTSRYLKEGKRRQLLLTIKFHLN
jgi:hypothetical protein